MKEFKKIEDGKRSERIKGRNNPRWNCGISEYPNHAEFKRMRIKVLQRSKGKCEICGEPAKIVHHIDGDKSNHSMDNLIALCWVCHDPLHYVIDGRYVRGRLTTKYNIIYGLTIKEIAERFGVTVQAIYYWIRNPEKRKWMEQKLEEK